MQARELTAAGTSHQRRDDSEEETDDTADEDYLCSLGKLLMFYFGLSDFRIYARIYFIFMHAMT